MGASEGAFGGWGLELFDEDAVGDGLEWVAKVEFLDELDFVFVEAMDEGGAFEHGTVAERHGDFLFKFLLGHGPWVKHAMDADGVGDMVFEANFGGLSGHRAPDVVRVQEVHLWAEFFEFCGGAISGDQFGFGRAFDGVKLDGFETGESFERSFDRFLGVWSCVGQEMDFVSQCGLGGGNSGGHHWGPAGGWVD